MAGDKAKENKKLTAVCAACDQELSTELLKGVVVGCRRKRRIIPVCQPCQDKGWSPKERHGAEPGSGKE